MTGRAASAIVSRRMKILSASSRSRWVSLRVIGLPFARSLATCHLRRRGSGLGLHANSAGRRAVTKSLILTLAAITFSSAASGQTAPKPISRAEYTNVINSRFGTMDTNHDGNVSSDELAAQEQKDLAQAKANLDANLRDAFKQLDTNKDGALSLAEFLGSAPGIKTAQ